MMDSELKFFVPGIPAPGGSKTGFYNKKLNRVLMSPASKNTKPWMQAVAGTVRSLYDGAPLTGPLRLHMQFRMLRPKGHYGSGKNAGVVKERYVPALPTVKPDLTKLVRATEDALTGILWIDDTQVVAGVYSKIYVERDPGVRIEVSEVSYVTPFPILERQ